MYYYYWLAGGSTAVLLVHYHTVTGWLQYCSCTVAVGAQEVRGTAVLWATTNEQPLPSSSRPPWPNIYKIKILKKLTIKNDDKPEA